MKNVFKFASVAILALTATSSFAQVQEDQASTTLNVHVANAYEITIGQAQVDINMTSPSQFQTGTDSGSQVSHLQISATGQYQVSVQATSELVNTTDSGLSIPVNTVTVTPTLGALLGPGSGAPTTLDLVADQPIEFGSENTIITSDTGESLRAYDVLYAIPAASAPQYLNQAPGTYSTTVVYTLYSL